VTRRQSTTIKRIGMSLHKAQADRLAYTDLPDNGLHVEISPTKIRHDDEHEEIKSPILALNEQPCQGGL
jgi:hypothetical protein